MSEMGNVRVNYFDQQVLRAQDFIDEQTYHLNMRRRHNIGHHTWGIVYGLELQVEENRLFVNPGMAIDGYGRELVLSRKTTLGSNMFATYDSQILNVWLTYNLARSAETPIGYSSLHRETDETANNFYRWEEKPRIWMTAATSTKIDYRRPEVVPVENQDFKPYRTPLDNPQASWPVYLGYIRQQSAGNQNQPASYTTHIENRPYAGLIGSRIETPSKQVHLDIGSHDSANRESQFSLVINKDKQPKEALKVDRSGAITIGGKTIFQKDVTLAAGGIEFQAGVGKSQPNVDAWQIYLWANELLTRTDKNQKSVLEEQQIRVQMGRSDESEKSQFVVGAWSAENEAFEPSLTVSSEKVIVHKDLIVEGQIIETTPRDPGKLTQAAGDYSRASRIQKIANQLINESEAAIEADQLIGRYPDQLLDAILKTPQPLGQSIDTALNDSERNVKIEQFLPLFKGDEASGAMADYFLQKHPDKLVSAILEDPKEVGETIEKTIKEDEKVEASQFLPLFEGKLMSEAAASHFIPKPADKLVTAILTNPKAIGKAINDKLLESTNNEDGDEDEKDDDKSVNASQFLPLFEGKIMSEAAADHFIPKPPAKLIAAFLENPQSVGAAINKMIEDDEAESSDFLPLFEGELMSKAAADHFIPLYPDKFIAEILKDPKEIGQLIESAIKNGTASASQFQPLFEGENISEAAADHFISLYPNKLVSAILRQAKDIGDTLNTALENGTVQPTQLYPLFDGNEVKLVIADHYLNEPTDSGVVTQIIKGVQERHLDKILDYVVDNNLKNVLQKSSDNQLLESQILDELATKKGVPEKLLETFMERETTSLENKKEIIMDALTADDELLAAIKNELSPPSADISNNDPDSGGDPKSGGTNTPNENAGNRFSRFFSNNG